MRRSQSIIATTCAAFLTLAAATTAFADKDRAGVVGSDQAMLFTATLTTDTVQHKLYQPGEKAPQPFYKKKCAKEKPQSYKNAGGQATLWFDPQKNVVWYAFSYHDLSGSPIMMHFHLGGTGVGGPIVQTICGMPPPSSPGLGYSKGPLSATKCPNGTSGFVFGHYKLKGNPHLKPALTVEQERKDLMDGKLYINIHTCLNELGELRGQVVPLKQ